MNERSQTTQDHRQVELSNSHDDAVSAGLARSESVYDNCDHEIWQHAVYNRIHQGKEFANISGIRGLDYFAASISDHDATVLDFGCGAGDACIYLARAYCYRVIGIDVNRKQVSRARKKSAWLTEVLSEAPRYLVSDLESCGFDEDFDGAFCLDSLSLIVNPDQELHNMSSALRANAPFLVTDIFAGAKLGAAARCFALHEDGMVSLTSQDTFSRVLTDAGFCQITWTDQTDLAVKVFTSILAGVEDYSRSSGRQLDPLVEEWLVSSRFYVDAFRERQFEYAWCLARKG